MLKFDKEKYLNIMKSDGINAALTALHQDTTAWEYDAFEGERGYQPEMISDLEAVRKFSRELWDMALRGTGPTGH